jgi:hypothetical protein
VTDVTVVTPFFEGGERPEPKAVNGADRGLSPYLIRQLASWYLAKFEKERLATGTVQQRVLDAELRAVLNDRGVFPEFMEIEFERVMEVVHSPLGQGAGR